MTIPGQIEIEAAWLSLPSDTRDRLGIIAVDMVFQGFVYGDAYVANGQFEDLPVYDPNIRAAAADAENRRLNELTKVVEDALPDLFGKDENPAWSENPGKTPTPAARAWAARERAERAEAKARLDAELEAEDTAAARADRSDHALAEAERAVRFALKIDDHDNVRDFLGGWLKGDTSEWPVFAEGETEPREECEAADA